MSQTSLVYYANIAYLLLLSLFSCFRYRNTGIGVCSMMARFGSIVTPYIVLLVCIISFFIDTSSLTGNTELV